jgi:GTP-dependent phosphoenolpyruvate carboxykinase
MDGQWAKLVGRMADVEGSRTPTRHTVARGANTLAHDSMQILPFTDYRSLSYYQEWYLCIFPPTSLKVRPDLSCVNYETHPSQLA